MDSKYFSLTWFKSYKHIRLGRLYIEWWMHSHWGCGASPNFYQMHIGKVAMAWARFPCL